jgi:hypothetical protein
VDNAVGRVASILCIPYGYTLSLWCVGALAVHRYGRPAPLEVVLFAAGGVSGFLLLAALGRAHLEAEVPMRVPALVVANAVPLVVVLAALGIPFGLMSRRLGFFTASLAATTVYMAGVAAVARLARRRTR